MSESSDNFLGSGSEDEAPKPKPQSSRPLLYLSSSSSDETSGGEAELPPPPDLSQNTASSSQNKDLMIELGLSSSDEDEDDKTQMQQDLPIDSTKDSSRLFNSSDEESVDSPRYSDFEGGNQGETGGHVNTSLNSTSQALFGEELSSSSSDDDASSNAGSRAEPSGANNRKVLDLELTGESEDAASGEEGVVSKQEVLEELVVDDHNDEFLDEVRAGVSDEQDEAAGFLSDDDDILGLNQSREPTATLSAQMPRCSLEMGSDLFYVKLPNFLSIDTRPFNSSYYEYEGDDDEVMDEEGRKRLKLKVENTIRWRKTKDQNGQDIRESNARLVKWKNGTMSLYLGSEIFDVSQLKMEDKCNHLYLVQNAFLQAQAVFNKKLTIKPTSTDSQTHRKITLSIADRVSRAQKMRMIPAIGENPEVRRAKLQANEEERARKLKQSIANERSRKRKLYSGHKLSRKFLEENEDLSDEGMSVSAIKRKYQQVRKPSKSKRKGSIDDFIVDSDEKESFKASENDSEADLTTSTEGEKDSYESDVGTRKRHNSFKSNSSTVKRKKVLLDDSESSDGISS